MNQHHERVEKHQGLVHKLAQQFSNKFDQPFDELLGVAQCSLVKTSALWESKYRPLQGAESTWVYQCVYWDLLTHCLNEINRPVIPLSALTADEDEAPVLEAKPRWVEQLLTDLGEDARLLVRTVVVDVPNELLKDLCPHTRARARKRIHQFFTETMGWSEAKLEKAWGEVAACL